MSPDEEPVKVGAAIRGRPIFQREVLVRRFYRALFGAHRYSAVNQLTALTLNVWAHPERCR